MVPYAIPQQWVAAAAAMSTDLRYDTRFSSSSDAHAVALFGPAGEADWPAAEPADIVSVTVAASEGGVAVLGAPRTVTIVPPPD